MPQPAARQGDPVVGTDTHILLVPSPGGPVPTPTPLPFSGRLASGTSTDVFINGQPAATGHALLQLSSGSTGPSKVIGRTAANLVAEVDRYTRIDGVPRPGERIVVLASMVHVLGLVGGLLYGLHAHARLVVPDRLTGRDVLRAVGAEPEPTTVLGVPFHIELLASVDEPPSRASWLT